MELDWKKKISESGNWSL